jgi:O-antigen/teichoic acid export membrane protein
MSSEESTRQVIHTERARASRHDVNSSTGNADSMSLRAKAYSAAWWTTGRGAADELLRLVFFVVLARLLSPEVYGLMALVMVYLAIVEVVAEHGFTRTLIQKAELRPEHLDTAFWYQILLSLLAFTLGVLGAHPIARLLGQPQLAAVLQALAVMTPLVVLNSVQRALLQREFRLNILAVAKLASTLAGGALGVTLALRGFGIWSLVAQQLAAALLGAVVVWAASAWRPGLRVRRAALGELLSFSSSLLALGCLNLLKNQADKFIIGVFLGPASLGFYSVSRRLVDVLVNVFVRPISQLTLPVFSRLQHSQNQARAAYALAIRGSTAFAIPVLCVLFVLAPDIVSLTLGARWSEVSSLIRLLSLFGLCQVFLFVDFALILSLGGSFQRLKLNSAYVLLSFVLLLISAPYGLEAICASIVVSALLFLPVELRHVDRLINFGAREHVDAIWPAAFSSVVMVGAILAVKHSLATDSPAWQVAAASIFTGACVYGLCLFSISADMRRLASEILANRPSWSVNKP